MKFSLERRQPAFISLILGLVACLRVPSGYAMKLAEATGLTIRYQSYINRFLSCPLSRAWVGPKNDLLFGGPQYRV
jgi:hypothetical protein